MTRHLSGGWAIVNEKASMHAGAWRVGRRSSRRAALGVWKQFGLSASLPPRVR